MEPNPAEARTGVGEGDPRSPVHEPPRVQVALVDDDPAATQLVGQLQRLDPHVRRKAPLDPLLDLLGGDVGIRLRHGRGERTGAGE